MAPNDFYIGDSDRFCKNLLLVECEKPLHYMKEEDHQDTSTGSNAMSEVSSEFRKAANVEIAKLVHAEELGFRIRNRRNKQFGLWAASQLGLKEDAADYAKGVVVFGLAEPDDENLIRHIHADLSDRGLRIPEAAIRYELERQAVLAMRECTLSRPATAVAH
jgi:hypothetical protein